MQSPTLNSIERIQAVVEELRNEGIDPLFIYSALAQVMADIEPDALEFADASRAELSARSE